MQISVIMNSVGRSTLCHHRLVSLYRDVGGFSFPFMFTIWPHGNFGATDILAKYNICIRILHSSLWKGKRIGNIKLIFLIYGNHFDGYHGFVGWCIRERRRSQNIRNGEFVGTNGKLIFSIKTSESAEIWKHHMAVFKQSARPHKMLPLCNTYFGFLLLCYFFRKGIIVHFVHRRALLEEWLIINLALHCFAFIQIRSFGKSVPLYIFLSWNTSERIILKRRPLYKRRTRL